MKKILPLSLCFGIALFVIGCDSTTDNLQQEESLQKKLKTKNIEQISLSGTGYTKSDLFHIVIDNPTAFGYQKIAFDKININHLNTKMYKMLNSRKRAVVITEQFDIYHRNIDNKPSYILKRKDNFSKKSSTNRLAQAYYADFSIAILCSSIAYYASEGILDDTCDLADTGVVDLNYVDGMIMHDQIFAFDVLDPSYAPLVEDGIEVSPEGWVGYYH